MRTNKIPDTYVGSKHLTSWFKKNLQMKQLDYVYVDPDMIRSDLTKRGFSVVQGHVLLSFKDKSVLSLQCPENVGVYKL